MLPLKFNPLVTFSSVTLPLLTLGSNLFPGSSFSLNCKLNLSVTLKRGRVFKLISNNKINSLYGPLGEFLANGKYMRNRNLVRVITGPENHDILTLYPININQCNFPCWWYFIYGCRLLTIGFNNSDFFPIFVSA